MTANLDEKWVRRTLAGSEEAFAEIVKRYQRPVFSIIVRMVRDAGLAEDLTQETFIKAFRALKSFDPKRKLSSWLFTIAHNTAIDHLRRKALQTVPLEAESEGHDLLETLPAAGVDTPERAAMSRELAQAFERELRAMRPEYAEILVLRFQEGLAYEEISEVTGLPIGTVKTHLFRARRQLAKRLARHGLTPGD